MSAQQQFLTKVPPAANRDYVMHPTPSDPSMYIQARMRGQEVSGLLISVHPIEHEGDDALTMGSMEVNFENLPAVS